MTINKNEIHGPYWFIGYKNSKHCDRMDFIDPHGLSKKPQYQILLDGSCHV